MEIKTIVQIDTTTRITFTDEQIVDILFKEAGIEKNFGDSCEFDVGQVFRGAILIIKRTGFKDNVK